MNSLQQVRAQFVVSFVHGKIQLVEAKTNKHSKIGTVSETSINTKYVQMVVDQLNDHLYEFGTSEHHSCPRGRQNLVREL